MAKKFLVNIDLGGNQVQNAILASTRVKNDPAASPPAVVGAGQLWYDSTNNQLNVYNGSSFQPLTTGGTAVTSLNGFTGGVNIYGTSNQVTVTNNTGSITLSLPSTISGISGNFNGASVSGSVLATQAYVGTASVAYATNAGNSSTTSQTNFSALTISGSNVATQAYVSTASVAYATNAGNAATTSQTSFTTLSTSGDISVGGNLYISGSTTTISGSTMVISDPMIYLANNNPANLNDIGFTGHFTAGTYQHTGLVRDHTDGTWKLFSGIATEPSNVIDFSSATYDPLKTGGLQINSGSTTTTASITSSGSATFAAIIKSGGTSSQFLKADGSVDSSTYATQTYVNSTAWNNTSASVGYATNSGSLGGVAAGSYALLSSANFTAASVGGSRIITTSDTLAAHAATTSSQLAGVISDDTGSGSLVFSGGPTFTGTINIVNASATGNVYLPTTASIGTSPIASQSYVGTSGWNNTSASVGYAANASNSTTTSQTNFASLTVGNVAVSRKFVTTASGTGAATSFTASHNFGTQDVIVRVYQTSATPDTQYADVEVDIVRTSASVVTVSFATAPASGANYNIVVVG